MLNKQNISISFTQGLDTKTDPWQVRVGNFLKLVNSIFTKSGLLQKRNGFGQLTTLPDSSNTYLTTFNGGLTAVGTSLNSYSDGSKTWTKKGNINPVTLSVDTLVRNNLNQSYADAAVSDNGLICTAYLEVNGNATQLKYTIADSDTSQTVVVPTLIEGTGTATYAPRVFYLKPYFIIVFDDVFSGSDNLKYIAISETTPSLSTSATLISNAYSAGSQGTFDGIVVNSNLYIFFNGTGTTIKGIYLSKSLVLSTSVSYASQSGVTVNVTSDISTSSPIIYASWISSGTGGISALATDSFLNPVLAPTILVTITDPDSGRNVSGSAKNGVLTIYYETASGSTSISTNTVTQGGTVGTPSVLARSIGLASKTVIYNGLVYFLGLYVSTNQPTYFLMNSNGQVVSRFAYQNGPQDSYIFGLPTLTLNGSTIQAPYLYADLIQSVNKNTNNQSGTQIAQIYSQTGVNLINFKFGTSSINTTEIGNNLNISGGFLTMYDGVVPVEQNFFLYPDSISASTATTGGFMSAQKYFYQVTYEWTDNQGNAFRSAPSVPISITTTGSTSTVTLIIPTLRLTYKISSPVKIVIYRWSVGQESYYQVTSITSPLLNNVNADSVTFVDTLSDASIIGNNLIYTTGGIVEDTAPPAPENMFLFDDRLWLIDSEDRNLLYYSKQVIESTPVEMSDLFTIYVAPTTSSQGSSGDLTCGFPMDDKAILFKESAIYYINGTGPDNTGSNSQYSQPIFITGTVGCSNPNSIVLIPNGLMFQSDKGIWLLGRDLSTTYIGAPVEEFNSYSVVSALNISTENQVRFNLSNGETLMYDYFYSQWGTFENIPCISSTSYGGLHTFINSYGQVYQETPGKYLDGSNPVLLSFTTSWINLAGLQGYQRAYFFYLLGQYLTPHKLAVSMAYDYSSGIEQTNVISPDNYSPAYGGISSNGQQAVYGQNTPYGGPSNVEQWRVFLDKQRCQSIQITLQEIYDPSFGIPAGEGLTLSGINLVAAIKKGWRPISASNTVGGS